MGILAKFLGGEPVKAKVSMKELFGQYAMKRDGSGRRKVVRAVVLHGLLHSWPDAWLSGACSA